jgi:catechol 2,3-dioxygenase-like lactoylglutathione lyase family enzyme
VAIELDHLILAVNDRAESVAFYTSLVGLGRDPDREPFSMLRVSPGFVIQLAAWGTQGGEHLAFAMSKREFEAVFERLKASGIPYGDSFDAVGNFQGPGAEPGSRGMGESVYFFDPNRHLIEIRHYGGSAEVQARSSSARRMRRRFV